MEAKADKVLSTASYILVNLIQNQGLEKGIEAINSDELTSKAYDLTMKLIEKIPDDEPKGSEDYNVPSDEECLTSVKAAFRVMNDRQSTKSQLANAIVLKFKVKKMIAEYIISRAEGLGLIKAFPRGNCIDYALA